MGLAQGKASYILDLTPLERSFTVTCECTDLCVDFVIVGSDNVNILPDSVLEVSLHANVLTQSPRHGERLLEAHSETSHIVKVVS